MLSYIDSFLNDPKGMLIFFLLAFPGRILALSAHEWGHAFVADRCGDHTARYLGRLTLNPFKHLDLIGTIFMLVLGFGWAKPVPVNPNNFRNYRRDDLKVSVAGVTMNLIMFLAGCVLMYAFAGIALNRVPSIEESYGAALMRGVADGEQRLFILQDGTYYYYPMRELLRNAPYIGDILIAPVFGSTLGYLYQMLSYFVIVNIVLAVFNLLPVPPLDGYHVLNDLFLRRGKLFVKPQTARAFTGVLMILCVTGILGKGLSFVETGILNALGDLAARVLRLL